MLVRKYLCLFFIPFDTKPTYKIINSLVNKFASKITLKYYLKRAFDVIFWM